MEISESEAQRTGKYHRLTDARPASFLHSGFRYAPPLIHSPRRALCSFFAQLFFSKLCLTSLTNVHFYAIFHFERLCGEKRLFAGGSPSFRTPCSSFLPYRPLLKGQKENLNFLPSESMKIGKTGKNSVERGVVF